MFETLSENNISTELLIIVPLLLNAGNIGRNITSNEKLLPISLWWLNLMHLFSLVPTAQLLKVGDFSCVHTCISYTVNYDMYISDH